MDSVSMFIPCSADLLLPEIGLATAEILSRVGKTPVYHEEQTCCGQPAINSGRKDHGITAAKHFIEVFENDEIIVSPSGSCVDTVRNQYPLLLEDEPDWRRRAEDIGSRIYELSQYLVDVLKVTDVGASYSGKVTFHESCRNLRGLSVSDQPRQLLNAVKGIELVPLEGAEVCCGFGGEFSMGFPRISEALVQNKTDSFIKSEADILILSEPGCLLNVKGYLDRHHPDRKAQHLADFLANS